MEVLQLSLPMGYTVQEETLTLPVTNANVLRISKSKSPYTGARLENGRVSLTRHFVQCPHCGHRVWLYAKTFNPAFNTHHPLDEDVSSAEIAQWAYHNADPSYEEVQILPLNRVLHPKTAFTCPQCKNAVSPSEDHREVEFERRRHKVIFRVKVSSIGDFIKLPCIYHQKIQPVLPVYETVCFNFRNGHTSLAVETVHGERLGTWDVTDTRDDWNRGLAYTCISKYKRVRRILHRLFSAEWKTPLPFHWYELGADELRLLTAFVGYPRSFYSAIPFAEGSLQPSAHFFPNARPLRKAANTVALYTKSQLPKAKTVRRAFFKNPALFFYLEECQRLWQIFRDPNLLCRILASRRIYHILSDLHLHPGVFTYLEDCVASGRSQWIADRVSNRWGTVCSYGINYNSMSPRMRQQEQKTWTRRKFSSFSTGESPHFAIPLSSPNYRIPDCTIDDFEFFWLKTTTDYTHVSMVLHNCLRDWSFWDSPVIGVRKDGEIVAAIEVDGTAVVQAFSARNGMLDKVPGLSAAYVKWFAKNQLTNDHCSLERLPRNWQEDEDLPF